MYSIKNRLTILILMTIVIGSTLATIGLYFLINSYFNNEFNQSLTQKARTLITLTTQYNGEIELEFAGEFMPEYEVEKNAEFFQLWFETKKVIERSDSLEFLNNADLVFLPQSVDQATFKDITLPDGRRGRAVSILFVPQLFENDFFEPESSNSDEDAEGLLEDFDPISKKHISETKAVITIAKETESLRQSIITGLMVIVGVFITLIVFTFLVCRKAISYGLSPINNICEEIDSIDVKNLSKAQIIETASLELKPIADQFNTVIKRINVEFDNQKRFTGDVAHELRTPIAELKMLSEVAAKWPEDTASNKQYFSDSIEVADNMERIVSDLLELVRSDSGNFQVILQDIGLNELLDKLITTFNSMALSRDIAINVKTDETYNISTDPYKIERILNNLIANAITYAAPGSEIQIQAFKLNAGCMIEVSNMVLNLEESDLDVMFERFWRKDKSRTGRSNSGLGLSIVKEICDQLGITVNAKLKSNRYLTISVGPFPLSQ